MSQFVVNSKGEIRIEGIKIDLITFTELLSNNNLLISGDGNSYGPLGDKNQEPI